VSAQGRASAYTVLSLKKAGLSGVDRKTKKSALGGLAMRTRRQKKKFVASESTSRSHAKEMKGEKRSGEKKKKVPAHEGKDGAGRTCPASSSGEEKCDSQCPGRRAGKQDEVHAVAV